jgi:ubiquinone/menaquinone biosynthesis C-methylase UbiE
VNEQRSDAHYSYSMYADPQMARTFDQRRFGGPIGDLVARTQARVLANMVGRIQERSILDVGTGTGRVASPASTRRRKCWRSPAGGRKPSSSR